MQPGKGWKLTLSVLVLLGAGAVPSSTCFAGRGEPSSAEAATLGRAGPPLAINAGSCLPPPAFYHRCTRELPMCWVRWCTGHLLLSPNLFQGDCIPAPRFPSGMCSAVFDVRPCLWLQFKYGCSDGLFSEVTENSLCRSPVPLCYLEPGNVCVICRHPQQWCAVFLQSSDKATWGKLLKTRLSFSTQRATLPPKIPVY